MAIGPEIDFSADMQPIINELLPSTPDINATPANQPPDPVPGQNAGFIQTVGVDPANAPGGGTDPAPIIPPQAVQAADYAEANGGAAQPGYQGDNVFQNDGRNGDPVLPQTTPDGQPITYREYDINPRVRGVNRGVQRVVIGSDGSRWYTNDHYHTFTGF